MTGKLEYAFTVRTIELEKGLANSAESEITLKLGSELAQLAETLSNGLEDMHGGNWKVVSHDTLKLDDKLVISVLVSRPASSEKAQLSLNRPNWYKEHPAACTCLSCTEKKLIKNQHGKVGRNEKCPCGSDKKYKKCHGN